MSQTPDMVDPTALTSPHECLYAPRRTVYVKRPHWYDYRISSFGNYMPTYWRRDISPRGGGGRGLSSRESGGGGGTNIIAYIAAAIGLFIGAGLLVAFL